VNDTAWKVISIARHCAKEDTADLIGGVSFAFFVVHQSCWWKGKKEEHIQKTKTNIQNLL